MLHLKALLATEGTDSRETLTIISMKHKDTLIIHNYYDNNPVKDAIIKSRSNNTPEHSQGRSVPATQVIKWEYSGDRATLSRRLISRALLA